MNNAWCVCCKTDFYRCAAARTATTTMSTWLCILSRVQRFMYKPRANWLFLILGNKTNTNHSWISLFRRTDAMLLVNYQKYNIRKSMNCPYFCKFLMKICSTVTAKYERRQVLMEIIITFVHRMVINAENMTFESK